MRFRRLSLQELEPLQDEFKHFLSANGLPAEEWALIKQTDAARADELVDSFSDMVLERALKNIKTVEFKTPDKWYIFRYETDDAVCILLESEDVSSTNLIEVPFGNLFNTELHLRNISLSRLKKPYKKNREEELFILMNNGSTIADDKLFDLLVTLEAEH
ncbi:MAG: hypothetical protein RI894_1491 [Bacteroidota bacterium]|jgi:hypothetical protein